jgi:hypothetical protein
LADSSRILACEAGFTYTYGEFNFCRLELNVDFFPDQTLRNVGQPAWSAALCR